jgi:hypothetical protein
MSAMKREFKEEPESHSEEIREVLANLVLHYGFEVAEALEVFQGVRDDGPAIVTGNSYGKGLRAAIVSLGENGTWSLQEFS